MKRSRFTETQVVSILKEADAGRLPVRFPGPRSMMYRKYLRLANPCTPFQAPQRQVLKFSAQNPYVDIHISRVSSSAVHIDRMNLRNFPAQSDRKHVV